MATASFAGTTFWNDASTGIERLQAFVQERAPRYVLRRQPRGGMIAQEMGVEPARILLRVQYSLSSTGLSNLLSSLSGMYGEFGTLAYPGRSFPNCLLIRPATVRDAPHQVENGTIETRYVVDFEFQQIR